MIVEQTGIVEPDFRSVAAELSTGEHLISGVKQAPGGPVLPFIDMPRTLALD